MSVRRCTAEHPFGTLKSWMGATHFLRRTKDKVDAEMNLFVLAYNIKRMIKIMGIKLLLEAIRAHDEALSTFLSAVMAPTSRIGRSFALVAVTIPKSAPDQLRPEALG